MKGNATEPDILLNDYMTDGEFIFIGRYIYWKEAGQYHRVTGTMHG